MSIVARACAAAFALSVVPVSAPASAQTIRDQFNLGFDSFTTQSEYLERMKETQERLNSILSREEIAHGYRVIVLNETSSDPETNPKPTNQKQAAQKKQTTRHLATRKGYYSVCTTDKETGEDREFAVAASFAYDVHAATEAGLSPQSRFNTIEPLEDQTYRFLRRLSMQKTPYKAQNASIVSNMLFQHLYAFNDKGAPGFYRGILAESGIVTGPGCKQDGHDEASFKKMEIGFIDGTASGTPNEPEIKAGMEIVNIHNNAIAEKAEFISACTPDKSLQIVAPIKIAYNMTAAYHYYTPASIRAEAYELVKDNARGYLTGQTVWLPMYTAEHAGGLYNALGDHMRTSIETLQQSANMIMSYEVLNIPAITKGCIKEEEWTWTKYNEARALFVTTGSEEMQKHLAPAPASVPAPRGPQKAEGKSGVLAPI